MPNGDVTTPGTGAIKLNEGVISIEELLKASLISIASLFDFIREMNIFIDNKEMSYSNLKESKELIERINKVIDVLETKSEKDKMINEITNLNFDKLLEERNKARKEKDWISADKIRKDIRNAGYDIEDTESGSRIIRIKKNTE